MIYENDIPESKNGCIEVPFENKGKFPVVAGSHDINPAGSNVFYPRFKPNGVTDNRDTYKAKRQRYDALMSRRVMEGDTEKTP
jgi:hypothetical protein